MRWQLRKKVPGSAAGSARSARRNIARALAASRVGVASPSAARPTTRLSRVTSAGCGRSHWCRPDCPPGLRRAPARLDDMLSTGRPHAVERQVAVSAHGPVPRVSQPIGSASPVAGRHDVVQHVVGEVEEGHPDRWLASAGQRQRGTGRPRRFFSLVGAAGFHSVNVGRG